MADEERQTYCRRCGSPVDEQDRFCGACGARAAPVTPDDPRVIPGPAAAAAAPGKRRTPLLPVVAGAALALLAGGALAFFGFGPGPVSADAPPDPAFDRLLPTLQGMTDAPIVLPAELPDGLDRAAVDGYLGGDEDGYGIVFPSGPTGTVARVSIAETLGTLRAHPKEEDAANEYFDAERVERVELPDGTEATLRYMVPAGGSGSQGPFWEGKFDKGSHTYVLTVAKPDEVAGDDVRRALSTMVEVEE